jgi:23S rRNA (adenine2503-C2)-methyltransferase
MTASTSASKPNLYGLDRGALADLLHRYDAPGFHAGQIHRWLYARRCFDAAAWTDLPRELRRRLSCDTAVDPGRLADRSVAADGTIKYRIELAGGGSVESVCMAQSGRMTLCISSQVGCALDCDFCLTGKMGLERHLDAGEIVGQIARIQEDRGLGKEPFNVVFMGMGEPLHNYDQVLRALDILTDDAGFGLSRRRITVSTAGLAPAIERLARESLRPRLAVSLNATTDEIRDRIMPVNRKYPLARLLEACRDYGRTTGERFTLEYVLLAGVNDGADDLRRLSRMVRRLPAKLNLIPFNPVEGRLEYRPPSRRRAIAIRDRLLGAGVPTSIRWSRGADARAACGQLALLPGSAASGRAATKVPG